MTALFDEIDTFILRVSDYRAAASWYAAALGLHASFTDPAQGLAVLPLARGSSLTLWQRDPGKPVPGVDAQGAYPIFATRDAAAAAGELKRRGVRVGDLVHGDGVRYFQFQDMDGNCLEACQILEPSSGTNAATQ